MKGIVIAGGHVCVCGCVYVRVCVKGAYSTLQHCKDNLTQNMVMCFEDVAMLCLIIKEKTKDECASILAIF